MTRPDHPELRELVQDEADLWVPPFLMTLISNPGVYEALTPQIQRGSQQQLTGGTYLYRLLYPLQVGYLSPGNGSYAEPFRRACDEGGITAEQRGQLLSWHLELVCNLARRTGDNALEPVLRSAAKGIAGDFAADLGVVTSPEAALRMQYHFSSANLAGIIDSEARDKFWEVLSLPMIRRIVDNKKDAHILGSCQEFCPLLPGTLIAQFVRD